MEKDYQPSKKYAKEIIDSYDISYEYRDMCVDYFMNLNVCLRLNPKILENSFVYSLPVIKSLSSCNTYKQQWKKCEDYREQEIFEEMRRLYVENLKLQSIHSDALKDL